MFNRQYPHSESEVGIEWTKRHSIGLCKTCYILTI